MMDSCPYGGSPIRRPREIVHWADLRPLQAWLNTYLRIGASRTDDTYDARVHVHHVPLDARARGVIVLVWNAQYEGLAPLRIA